MSVIEATKGTVFVFFKRDFLFFICIIYLLYFFRDLMLIFSKYGVTHSFLSHCYFQTPPLTSSFHTKKPLITLAAPLFSFSHHIFSETAETALCLRSGVLSVYARLHAGG